MVKNMDTSTKYIEMCRAASEIQKAWEPAVCDWRTNSQKCMMLPHACRGNPLYVDKENDFWLPRQDQLQEMITGDDYLYRTEFGNSSGALFEAITEFAHREDCGESFEMLWLIFVMERKFKKFWDGAAWVDTTGTDPDTEKKSLLSQILDARTRLECDHVKPTHLLIHQKAWDKLVGGLLYGDTRVVGLKIVITDTISDIDSETDFMVVGVPL